MTSKSKGIFWIALVVLVAIYFSNGIALLVHLIPHSTEREIAEKLNVHFHPNLCVNPYPETQKVLDKFVARLFPIAGLDSDKDFQLRIQFIHNDEVNAFATLGGDIYVYSGLLRDVSSPEELAGVIAHEMAHQKERHILQGIFASLIMGSNAVPDSFFKIAFSQSQEREADELGLKRLKAAQINAQGYVDFFNKRGSEPDWLKLFNSHPGSKNRMELARQYLNLPSRSILDKKEWALLRNYCL